MSAISPAFILNALQNSTLAVATPVSGDTMINITAITDIFYLFFWIALVGVMAFVMLILFKFYQAVKDFRAIVADNRKNINLIINQIPQITQNIQEVTTEVSHATQKFRPTVDNIADASESTTETIKNNNPINETIISAYKTVNNVHKLVESFNKKHDKKPPTNSEN